jgi:hypothetical protein
VSHQSTRILTGPNATVDFGANGPVLLTVHS